MTGLLVFLVLLLIVMQCRLLQELLGLLVLAFVAAVAYGYFISSTTQQPPAEARPAVIHQAPEPRPAPPPTSSPASPPVHYNFDPWQGPQQPRPYRQQ